MDPIFLLNLASRKTAYLAARQATLANNVANINTPGFKAKDLVQFTDVLSQTQLQLASTDPNHLSVAGVGEAGGAGQTEQDSGFEETESGNSVDQESQMMKTGEVNREYALTTNIVKSFHAMLMASLRE
jgi:flagellar basal-body rod protein FlgB